jgi:hypothetical protein
MVEPDRSDELRQAHRGCQSLLWVPGALALIAALWINVEIISKGYTGHWHLGLVMFVPGALFMLAASLIPRGGWWLALSGFLSMAAFASLMLLIPSPDLFTVTDADRYQDVMEESGYPEAEHLAHFPAEIPDDARDVRFYHRAMMIRLAPIWELRMTVPPERVPGYLDHFPDEPPHFGTLPMHMGPSRDRLDDFPVIRGAYDVDQYSKGPVYGIAADPESGEIIFWATRYIG